MDTTEIVTVCYAFAGDKDGRVITFQYKTGSKLLEKMLKNLRKWESEGKLMIVDVRTPAQYHI